MPQSVSSVLLLFFQGILQALEYLLIKGYAPRRGFYIGLGHDEEVLKLFIVSELYFLKSWL